MAAAAIIGAFTSALNALINHATNMEAQQRYDDELNWQKDKFAQTMDFANRQLKEQIRIADQNLGFQQSQFAYQQDLNALQMAREDSAIQRQVADYQAAGFSPLAAIGGNGSASGSLNAGTAPQYDGTGIATAAGHYMDIANQYAALHEQLSSKRTEQKQAAQFALAQMRQDAFYKGQDIGLQYFNARVNARNQLLNNQSLAEDIKTKKFANEWYEKHGYSQQTLATVLSDFLNKTNVKEAFSKFSEVIGNGLNNLADSFSKFSEVFKGNKDYKFSNDENKELLNELSDSESQYVLDWCKKNNKTLSNLTLEDWFNIADSFNKK